MPQGRTPNLDGVRTKLHMAAALPFSALDRGFTPMRIV